MHYEITYKTTDPLAESNALMDCRKWLGNRQYHKVIDILKGDNGRTPRSLVIFGLSMQGIQGYPAQVMVDKYWSPQMTLDI